MSTVVVIERIALPFDEQRGRQSMLWFIATEAMLFVSLFFAYFLLAHGSARWPPAADPPPKMKMALVMLALLISSGIVLEVARHFVKHGRETLGRFVILLSALLGIAFVVIQTFEFRERLEHVKPTTDAYGSIFYTITSIHGAHVILGLLMLLYCAILPRISPGATKPPHVPLNSATLYWHFVDIAWIIIVITLYWGAQR